MTWIALTWIALAWLALTGSGVGHRLPPRAGVETKGDLAIASAIGGPGMARTIVW